MFRVLSIDDTQQKHTRQKTSDGDTTTYYFYFVYQCISISISFLFYPILRITDYYRYRLLQLKFSIGIAIQQYI